jgi:hypothetical protein
VSEDSEQWYYVKGWFKHQDYRYKRPQWIRLWKDIENDPTFLSLSEIDQWRLVRLWLYSAEMDGRLPRDSRKIRGRLSIYHEKIVDNLMAILISKSFISTTDIRGCHNEKAETGRSKDRLGKDKEEEQKHVPKEPAPAPEKLFVKRFVKPELPELIAYMQSQGLSSPEEEAATFFDRYEAGGWMVGKSPMKDWQAAVRNWKRNQPKFRAGGGNGNSRSVSQPNLGLDQARAYLDGFTAPRTEEEMRLEMAALKRDLERK